MESQLSRHHTRDVNAKDDDGSTALMCAAADDHVEAIAELVRSDADVNASDIYGRTALMRAAANGNVKAIAELVRSDADVNASDIYGRTALMWAAVKGNVEAIAELVRSDADVNHKSSDGSTALMLAADNGNVEAIIELVRSDADVNHKNNDGYTALMWAADNGNVEAIAELVRSDADVNHKSSDGSTALMLAAATSNVEAIAELVTCGADVNVLSKEGRSALSYAAERGHVETITELARSGANMNAKNNNGYTALMWAAATSNVEVIAELVRSGADVNHKSSDGSTALMLAAVNGNVKAIIELVRSDADVNHKNNDGYTALMRAAVNGNVKAIIELVRSDADVNHKSSDGYTALMLAAATSNVKAIAELVRSDADVNASDIYGRTALMLATANGNVEAIAELVRSGADMNAKDNGEYTALMVTADYSNVEAITELTTRDTDVNHKNNDGYTALLWAAVYGNVEAIAELVRSGVDVNVLSKEGRSALSYAAEDGNVEAVAELVTCGVDVNVLSKEGRSALSYAAERGHVEIIAKLLRYSAVIDGNSVDGKSALWHAAHNGQPEVVCELLRSNAFNGESIHSSEKMTFFEAAVMSDLDSMTRIIADGVPVDSTTSDGRTPLFCAAECDRTDAVRFLLDKGASVCVKVCSSQSSWDGYTPLLVAGRSGNMDIFQALVEKAATPVNVRGTADGETPLMSAARWNYFAGIRLFIAHGGALRFEDVAEDEYPLIPGTLETMKNMCVDTFEYESLCANVVERLQYICSQLQEFDSSRLQLEGSLVSFASIIFRFCRLLFDIKQRQRALSRFIANRAITGRIKDFQEELDYFIDMLGLARNSTSWKEGWSEDLSRLQSNFRDLLRSNDVLVDGCDDDEVKYETAVLLQYELGLCVGDGEQAVRESIDRVLTRFLHACAIDAPVVPKWFISRDDVQFYSWNLVRSESGIKFYEGKWRNSSVMVETADSVVESYMVPGFKVEQFQQAASQWYKQSHPNVVKLLGACHIGTPFLFIYEFVPERQPLHEYLTKESNRRSTWKLLHQAALGLQYLHNRGVVHTNFRGENIIVGSDSGAKLCNVHKDRRRFDNAYRCELNWQAPEVVLEARTESLASDIFAFGMCIWEAVTLELPWGELKRHDIWGNVWNKCRPERPSSMDDALWELITKMCAFEPSERVSIAFVVNRLKQFASKSELTSGGVTEKSATPFDASKETESQSLDEHVFAVLDERTIPEALEYLHTKCEKLPEDNWMACKVLPALKFIFLLLQERRKMPTDIEVVTFCSALSRFERYLRTAVSEKSVFELARSRQVAEMHHVIYAELDRLLDMLEVPETDSIRMWRSNEEPVIQHIEMNDSSILASSTLHCHGTGGGTSSGDAVMLNHFDMPFADHASWNKAGLTALNTPPSWMLPLRELLFSESDPIGQGSFGDVYKGSWLGTPVVVKFMGYEEDPNTISTDLLLHEVRVWHRLSHPHVLKLYGASHIDKRYFVCEFASNGDLTKYLSKKGNEHLMWKKMYEAALGLQYLHSQNVAHNDLKCDNIMVGMDGKAKLIDFGLSCLLNEAEIQIDVKEIGAVNWRSPEYLLGGRPSFASDVYSFAMCIIEAVSGDIPWGKMTPAAVRFQVLKRDNIPNLPESVNDKQRNLIKLMTKQEPSKRVKMAFVVEKLREFEQDEMALGAP